MYKLRPYQEEALRTIFSAIPSNRHILVQMPTASGKTIVFSELIKRLLSQRPDLKIGILAHREILIAQASEKLLSVWPEAPIGIACTSVSGKIDTKQSVVIGSVQTLSRRISATAPFDLVIIDEAHRIPAINQKSQYGEWIQAMKGNNSNLRILGVTATPFRLGHGYIYGNLCKEGNKNLFDALHFRFGIRALQTEGFLCLYKAKEIVNIEHDLLRVKRTASEYNLHELSDEMSKKVHLGSAVKSFKSYGEDRKRVVIFAVTIDHAERLADAFRKAGYTAGCIHSKMPAAQKRMILREFETGRLRFLCNIGVLSEGWDSPAVDCIIFCRPTLSPTLYVQMVGRGLRPHPDKKDVLILDLANNCRTHGDPEAPNIIIPNGNGSNKKSVSGTSGIKTCPKCKEIIFLTAKECPECGYPLAVDLNSSLVLKDVKWNSDAINVSIEDTSISDYISRAGNRMLKLSLRCRLKNSLTTISVNEFFDFEGNGSLYGQSKARHIWRKITDTEPPETVSEAKNREGEILMSLPDQIKIIQKGKWWNVRSWR